jgi:hypothetical protein
LTHSDTPCSRKLPAKARHSLKGPTGGDWQYFMAAFGRHRYTFLCNTKISERQIPRLLWRTRSGACLVRDLGRWLRLMQHIAVALDNVLVALKLLLYPSDLFRR